MDAKKQAGFAFVELIILVVVLGIAGVVGWQVWSTYTKPKTTASTNYSASFQASNGSTPSLPNNAQQYTSLSAGSDNQSLNNDLSNINTNLSQGDQSLSAGTSAVNDQQNQISVPTN